MKRVRIRSEENELSFLVLYMFLMLALCFSVGKKRKVRLFSWICIMKRPPSVCLSGVAFAIYQYSSGHFLIDSSEIWHETCGSLLFLVKWVANRFTNVRTANIIPHVSIAWAIHVTCLLPHGVCFNSENIQVSYYLTWVVFMYTLTAFYAKKSGVCRLISVPVTIPIPEFAPTREMLQHSVAALFSKALAYTSTNVWLDQLLGKDNLAKGCWHSRQ